MKVSEVVKALAEFGGDQYAGTYATINNLIARIEREGIEAEPDKLAKVVRLLKDAIEEASPFTGCASKRQRNFAIVLQASFAEHILREIGEDT